MKKALIITYYWPPSGGAGVQRWLKFIKYLREFGWEPVVYTPKNPEYPETDESLYSDIPEGLTIIKTPIREPYSAYKRLIGRKKEERINASFLSEKKRNPLLENISIWIRGNFFIPDARMFWIRPSIKFLSRYLKDHPVDMIVSSGPPHSMHMIAMDVSRNCKIPWLADFRDPWTDIDFYRELKLTNRSDRRHHELEKKVLATASAVTTISESMSESFRLITLRDYNVITNGFDEDDSRLREEIIPDSKFSISYIGTMVSSRNPVSFWKAVRAVLDGNEQFGKDLVIKLVGKVDFKVLETIHEYGLVNFVERISYVPHNEAMKIQQQSQVLFLVINDTPNAKMILTGKFFEYLSAKRPILCSGPIDGDAAKILAETNSGLISGFSDDLKMKENILQFYERYQNGTLSSDSRDIQQYSRKELTRKLAGIMDRMTG